MTGKLSFINLVSIFRCSSSKTNPVYGRRVNSFVLVLVFHHTDTSLYLLSLALALSIHNKLYSEIVPQTELSRSAVDELLCPENKLLLVLCIVAAWQFLPFNLGLSPFFILLKINDQSFTWHFPLFPVPTEGGGSGAFGDRPTPRTWTLGKYLWP